VTQPYSGAKTIVNSSSTALLKLQLLGTPELFYAGERLSELSIQKAQAWLIYLVVENKLNPQKSIAKEKLTDLLWPRMPTESALQNLRQTLYQVRKAIPYILTATQEKVPLLESNRKVVWLHPQAVIETDVDELLLAE
jgi:DNA-binding SARP family transcriptional activator